MQSQLFYIKLLIKRISIILLLYELCRLLFLMFNYDYFSDIPFTGLLSTFIYGIRFDLSAIVYSNIIFISLHLIPHNNRGTKLYQFITKIIFYLFNGTALLFNIIDIEYFRFTDKRSTSDLFALIQLGEDFKNVAPQLLMDFGYYLMFLILILFAAEWLYRKTEKEIKLFKINYFLQTVFLIFSILLLMVIARGGTQLRPISVSSASQHVEPKLIPLVVNTPFSIIRTLGKTHLEEKKYFSENELNQIYPIEHDYQNTGTLNFLKQHNINSSTNENVIIIILEGFSKEFIGKLNNTKGYTPFLDSLISQSIVFPNAYANGKKSIEALPSILLGLPSFMEDPLITSTYQGNNINSIAGILKKTGYYSAFFHGGTNGTMGFETFIKKIEFDKYFGRTEYNNDDDFDGVWGIWDEEFLQFAATEISNFQKPFLGCIFTLSSHHPNSIPAKYSRQFEDETSQIHKSILYADFALKKFFESASKKSWFSNTLFIITADHTAITVNSSYYTRHGNYAIPMIIFNNKLNFNGESAKTVQHTDILPTILDYLNYKKKFFAFGESMFNNSSKGISFNYLNGIYQIMDQQHLLLFDGFDVTGLYDYTRDVTLKNNIMNQNNNIETHLSLKLQAVLQQYNNSLINNSLNKN